MAALLLILPLTDVTPDRCDSIELNHFYDGAGRPVFDQVIFWQGDRVRAWRLWKSPEQTPRRRPGGFAVTWFDGDRLREVRALSYRESWTQHDPELEDRDLLPAHERRGLTGESVRGMPPSGP